MNIRSLIGAIAIAVAGVAVPVGPAGAGSGYAFIGPSPLDFGTIKPNQSKLMSVFVTNTSNQDIEVVGSANTGPFRSDPVTAPETPRPGSCYYYSDTYGGNIAAPLAPGAQCQLYYRFSPTAAGAFSGSVVVGIYNTAGSTLDTHLQHFEGQAANAATHGGVSLTPNPRDVGTVAVGDAENETVLVTNTSNGNIQVTESISGASFRTWSTDRSDRCVNPSDPSLALVLGPGEQCASWPEFAPTATGAASGALTITVRPSTGDPGTRVAYSTSTTLATATATLTGTGVLGSATFAPTSLAFGKVVVGASKELTVAVTNTSPSSLQFVPTLPAGSGYVVGGGTATPCTSESPNPNFSDYRVVPAGGTCTLRVVLTPTKVATYNSTITVAGRANHLASDDHQYKRPSGPTTFTKTVSLTGTGVAATVTMTPAALDFSKVTVGGDKQLTLKITNTSTATMRYDVANASPFSAEHPAGDPGERSCVKETSRYLKVDPGEYCTYVITFHPPSVASFTSNLLVRGHAAATSDEYTDGISGQRLIEKSVTARGTGIKESFATDATSFAFGNVTWGGSGLVKVKYTNTSNVPIGFLAGFPAGTAFSRLNYAAGSADAAQQCVTPGEEAVMIAPGESCYVTGRFAPTGIGSFQTTMTGKLVRPSGNPAPANPYIQVGSFSLPATGTGVRATYKVAPTSLAFGNVTVGGSKVIVESITNTSDVPLAFSVGFASGTDYSRLNYPAGSPEQLNACVDATETPRVVPPGQSCTIQARFAPTKTGAAQHTLGIKVLLAPGFPGGPSTQVASASVAATGTGIAPTFTLSPTYLDFKAVTVSGTKSLGVTITNTSSRTIGYVPRFPAGSKYRAQYVGSSHDYCYAPDGGGSGVSLVMNVAPGQSCIMPISFTPTAVAAANETLTIDAVPGVDGGSEFLTTWGAAIGSHTLAVRGSGVAAAVTVTPTTLAFGTVTKTRSKILTTVVTNKSDIPLAFKPTFAAGSDYKQTFVSGGDTSGCTPNPGGAMRTIQPGDTCLVTVTFRPFKTGQDNGTITVEIYKPGATPTLIGTRAVPATGAGAAAKLALAPASLAFQTVSVGSSRTMVTTVTNTSDIVYHVGIGGLEGSAYTQVRLSDDPTNCQGVNGASVYIPPGASCILRIRFAPTAAGGQNKTFYVRAFPMFEPGDTFVPEVAVATLTSTATGK
ncbi:MAG: choice-of-anchor D domain-containing protein [Propionibacteriales bacterium]|nr:choice-of-anchor D domain-containing protein [Propionibacteriales bacterium]